MRIIVTGGSGFIGKHLLPLLDRHEVLCLSHAVPMASHGVIPRTIRGDLNTPASYADELECFKPECCIHLAWEGFLITRSRIAARTFLQVLICSIFLADSAAARYLQLVRAGNTVREQG